MHKFLFILLLTGLFIDARAQTRAMTENGKMVLLYDNGTWKPAPDSLQNSPKETTITTNPGSFTKPVSAALLLKSKITNAGLYIDSSQWTYNTPKEEDAAMEYVFYEKNGNGYALMITEKTPVKLDAMRRIALMNARQASPDIKEISSEYRMVNGKKVLCLEFSGTVSEIRFTYMGYYYSNEKGTIQLLTYAGEDQFAESKKVLENFLNGLVETQGVNGQ